MVYYHDQAFSVANNLGSACASAPCFNGGTCKNEGEAFVCTCLPGSQCQAQGKNDKNAEIFWQCTAIFCPMKVFWRAFSVLYQSSLLIEVDLNHNFKCLPGLLFIWTGK